MKTRRRSAQATRERLVDAAVLVLLREGPGALTTVRLAREAGVVQSGFYSHFGSVGALVDEAAARVGARLRGLIVQGLAGLRRVGGGDVAQMDVFFRQVLAWLDEERPFVELVLRYRRDPSPLGAAFARLVGGLSSDVADHLVLLWGTEAPPPERARAELHARLIVGLFLTAIEIHFDRPADGTGPPDELTRALAEQVEASARLLFGPAPAAPATTGLTPTGA